MYRGMQIRSCGNVWRRGVFVLLIGDSTAGKSRAAFEAVSATVPQHLLIRPSSRSSLAAAVAQAAQARRCVLWLDDLENYFGSDGLSINQLARLIHRHGHHRVIMATLRAAEKGRAIMASGEDDVARQVTATISVKFSIWRMSSPFRGFSVQLRSHGQEPETGIPGSPQL